jgi:hypothetical protein
MDQSWDSHISALDFYTCQKRISMIIRSMRVFGFEQQVVEIYEALKRNLTQKSPEIIQKRENQTCELIS